MLWLDSVGDVGHRQSKRRQLVDVDLDPDCAPRTIDIDLTDTINNRNLLAKLSIAVVKKRAFRQRIADQCDVEDRLDRSDSSW